MTADTQHMSGTNLETLQERWGERVANRRRYLGMSQRQLADKLGVDISHISRIERGRQSVTDILKFRIAGALYGRDDLGHLPVADLFPWDVAS